MNIQTVAENLRNTIASKERYLQNVEETLNTTELETEAHITLYATRGFLKVNIDELKRILQDVEQCVFDYDELKEDLKEANGRVRQLERENSDMGLEQCLPKESGESRDMMKGVWKV